MGQEPWNESSAATGPARGEVPRVQVQATRLHPMMARCASEEIGRIGIGSTARGLPHERGETR